MHYRIRAKGEEYIVQRRTWWPRPWRSLGRDLMNKRIWICSWLDIDNPTVFKSSREACDELVAAHEEDMRGGWTTVADEKF